VTNSRFSSSLPLLLLLPAFVILVVFTIYPTGYLLYTSLCKLFLNKPWLGQKFIGYDNYVAILSQARYGFWNSLRITLIFVISAVSIEFLLGFGIALSLCVEISGRRVFRSVLIIPMMIAPVVVALMWVLIVYPGRSILNYLLGFLGMGRYEWLGDRWLALYILMLADIWQWTPFVMLVLLSGLLALPGEPYEAAKVDGANNRQIFQYLTIPLLRPTILVALLIRSIDAFRIFDKVFVITQGGPGNSTMTLSMLIYNTAFKSMDIGKAAALSWVLILITIGFCQALIRLTPGVIIGRK